jgi:hypothetical protein
MAKFMMMAKLLMMNKCPSIVGHFGGHGGATGQYRCYCPMQHVQGYLGSHWIPPSATTCSILPQQLPGQQAKKQQSTNTPTLLAILMAMKMRQYNTACIAL